jgi:hypothetical protein
MQLDATFYVFFGIFGGLTWLIFVLAICKFSKLYLEFKSLQKEIETNLHGMSVNLRTMQASMAEMLIEQRRANKLMIELIDHSRLLLENIEIEEEVIEE